MARVTTTTYNNSKDVVLDAEYTIPVMLDASTISADGDGKKIVPAGTILGHATLVLKDNRTAKASPQNNDDAQGITVHEVDVTNGDKEVAMCIIGTFDRTKVTTVQIIHADAETALTKITFVTI